jgi:uncharacterized protein YlzI (FlbEa/FlbD family)
MPTRIVFSNGQRFEVDADIDELFQTLVGAPNLKMVKRRDGQSVYVNPTHIAYIEPGLGSGVTERPPLPPPTA